MNYNQKLLVGKALKALMQSYGCEQVFQNNYRTGTRTVKCYRNGMSDRTEMNLRLAVFQIMKAFEVSDYQVNLTNGNGWGGAGFIVKF